MFDITPSHLVTTIRCKGCNASLEIDTDDRRLNDRSIAAFQAHHVCRPPVFPTHPKSVSQVNTLKDR